ncbi:LytR/AlgR family response regulator transcription factor [Enterococcus mundtii]|uniref:DNA-binding response regulator n=1 Tax=Enterococcus mundtii TaxID=53346 RepID=A0A2S7RNH7_ENTMU|nr:LytTR family DNA-binding domain-containing protein [Enterococcus mundtii]MDA9462311.1 Response regulator of the competence regulon ComE [Enterococcus mundtii 3F]PQF20509.1 DNA-binding response regulator [Enterococcus mundtii]
MIPIYICEDDPKQLEVISTVIKNRIMIENLDSYVHIATSDPIELLNAARIRTSSFGIYFLDIELKDSELDGIAIGKRVRDLDSLGKIIYVTSHTDLSMTILKSNIEPTDYIIKEDIFDLKDNVERILSKIFEDFQTAPLQKDIFRIEFNDEIKFLPIRDIQYFSTAQGTPHKLEVHLTHAQMQFYEKIKDIEKKSQHFIRCHKSYVINTQNVQTINKKTREVTLSNGEVIPVSIRGLKKLIS